MSNVEYGLVMQEFDAATPACAASSACSLPSSVPIYTFGSDDQKNFWLPKMATGEKLAALV